MVRFYLMLVMCISIFTSTMLFGVTDFVQKHTSGRVVTPVVACAEGIYGGACKKITNTTHKYIALLKGYYYKQKYEPVTRAQALTAATVGVAGFGVYKLLNILIQK